MWTKTMYPMHTRCSHRSCGPHQGKRFDHQSQSLRLKINIQETEDKYELEMAVPGLTKEEVSVDFTNQILTVKTKPNSTESKTWLHQEFRQGPASRSIQFLEEVEEGAVSAKFADGVLHIVVPKKQKQSKKIEIL